MITTMMMVMMLMVMVMVVVVVVMVMMMTMKVMIVALGDNDDDGDCGVFPPEFQFPVDLALTYHVLLCQLPCELSSKCKLVNKSECCFSRFIHCFVMHSYGTIRMEYTTVMMMIMMIIMTR